MMVGMSFSSILDMQSLFFAADKIFEILDRKPLIDSNPATGLKLNNTLEGNIALKSGEFTYPTRPDIQVLNKMSQSYWIQYDPWSEAYTRQLAHTFHLHAQLQT